MLISSIIIIMDQLLFQGLSEGIVTFWEKFASWMNDHGWQIVLILVLAELTRKFGSKVILKIFESTIRNDIYPTKSDRQKRVKTLESLTSAILKVAVFVVAGIMIISELGLNTTPVVASAGILGLALGFGAQSLIKDLTAGVFIISENQYRVGDIIELDSGIKGKVEAITIRTTLIRNLSGTLYHVPNGTIGWAANKTSSYGGIAEDIVFSSDVDIEKLSLVIDRTSAKLMEKPELAKKIKEPPKLERVLGYVADGINVRIVGKTGSDNAFEIKDAFYRQLIKELRKSNINIPYPQITISHNDELKKSKKSS
jgi:small-conductance mechanosensitive channel